MRYTKSLIHTECFYSTGVNFINILRKAFARADPKSAKRYWKLDWLFNHLGSACIKALREHVAVGWNWHLMSLNCFSKNLKPVSSFWPLAFTYLSTLKFPLQSRLFTKNQRLYSYKQSLFIFDKYCISNWQIENKKD